MEHSSQPPFKRFASVVLDVALDRPLDYGIPDPFLNDIKKGGKVLVPLRNKPRKGYVIDIKEKVDFETVSPISELLIDEESIPDDLLELGLWMSSYYMTPLFAILNTLVPASVRKSTPKEQFVVSLSKSKEKIRELCIELRSKSHSQAQVLEVLLNAKKKMFLTELQEKAEVSRSPIATLQKNGAITLEKVRLFRSPLSNEEYFPTLPKTLTFEQKETLQKITSNMEAEQFCTYLLHGITGSGKTEIYCQAIEKALSMNKGAIMLVPEISLTVQTIERFRSRFEGHIAILHHRLSEGERFDEWERIQNGNAKIVIGARSALFSPVSNLGLIIVDEEHDSAYKQTDKMPCYHARDLSVMRGKITQATVILGSATPSLESYQNAMRGKYTLLSLPSRIANASLPTVTLVDMKDEFEKARGFTTFSQALIEGIKKRLLIGEQTILFLNRRGYHTTLLCERCGFIFKCPHCDLPMTFHYSDNILSCHLCDFRKVPPKTCEGCKSPETLKYKGIGTELVERSLHALFPEIRTLRMDADTTRHKGSHETLFRQFRTGKSDVLIGTQMIAKGLHFPSVTLVAILNTDSALHIPDFRASESVFQLITQVAGRSGRGALPGEVIIQTQLPENSTIQLALKQDFESFFKNEIEVRKLFSYPPYTHFIKILFEGKDKGGVESFSKKFRNLLVSKLPKDYSLHPLLPAGHPKIKDIYRFQFLIRGPMKSLLQKEIESVRKSVTIPRDIYLTIDVDPLSTYF